MRFSSSWMISTTLISIAAIVFSCSHRIGTGGPADGEISVRGRLGFAGETPFDRRIILSDVNGIIWSLKNNLFEGELLSLAGFDVKVTGRLLGQTSHEPQLYVEKYEIVPPDGEVVLIGTLAVNIDNTDGTLCLRSHNRGFFILRGRLVSALSAFTGQKVWVAGKLTGSIKGKAEGLTKRLQARDRRIRVSIYSTSSDSTNSACSINKASGVLLVHGYGVLGL